MTDIVGAAVAGVAVAAAPATVVVGSAAAGDPAGSDTAAVGSFGVAPGVIAGVDAEVAEAGAELTIIS